MLNFDGITKEEIKTFNSLNTKGYTKDVCAYYLNAARAQENLKAAPATILEYNYVGEITAQDSLPDMVGAAGFAVALLNCSAKTIKEVTFTFSFMHDDTQVFDIRTSDPHCELVFSNLAGRPESTKHNEIADNILNCYSLLTMDMATRKKLFFNSEANMAILEKVHIVYSDETTSDSWAFFDRAHSDDLDMLHGGPLEPLISYIEYEQTAQEERKSVTGVERRDNVDEHQAEYPGGIKALMAYVARNIQYPSGLVENRSQGKCIVQFSVEPDGTVGLISVERSSGNVALDDEARRVVSMLKGFKPATKNGEPVRAWFTLPLTFSVPQERPEMEMNRLRW